MPVLQTSRLTLRPFREEDVDLLAPLMANPDFMRFSLGVFSREQTAAFLDKVVGWQRRGLPSQFGVIHRADNRLIGYCGFLHQQVDGTDEIEIGYRLDPDYWSGGLATEAAQAVRDHAFRGGQGEGLSSQFTLAKRDGRWHVVENRDAVITE